jgi:hypothetical protein
MARYGRQTVSVDVDTGVLLFDKKTGTFGVETISHERGKQNNTYVLSSTLVFPIGTCCISL